MFLIRLHDLLATEFARRQRTGQPLCLAIIDLDHFKQVNDRYGHKAGDELLVAVAACLRRSVRSADVAVRQGGDEFAVVFHQVDIAQAQTIAARVVEAITELAAAYPGCELGASVGLAYFHRVPADVEDVIRRADATLYRAKTAGRRQVCIEVVGAPLEDAAPRHGARG